MQNDIQQRAVNDQIAYLSIGISESRNYIQHNFGSLGLSYSDNFNGYYKIAGFTVVANQNKITVERSVYDFLNFLRDVGGLNGILVIFGSFLISKIANQVTGAYFLSSMFKQTKADIEHPKITKENIREEIERNFDNRKDFQFRNVCQTIFFCIKKSTSLRTFWLSRKRAEP